MLTKKFLKPFVLASGFVVACTGMASADGPVVLEATENFRAAYSSTVIWYVDGGRESLAVNSVDYPDAFAHVTTEFSGEPGNYKLELVSLTENDGESQYRVSVNGTMVGAKSNPQNLTNWVPITHDYGVVEIPEGATIDVAFNSTTNGLVAEENGVGYARGRWQRIVLTPAE